MGYSASSVFSASAYLVPSAAAEVPVAPTWASRSREGVDQILDGRLEFGDADMAAVDEGEFVRGCRPLQVAGSLLGPRLQPYANAVKM